MNVNVNVNDSENRNEGMKKMKERRNERREEEEEEEKKKSNPIHDESNLLVAGGWDDAKFEDSKIKKMRAGVNLTLR